LPQFSSVGIYSFQVPHVNHGVALVLLIAKPPYLNGAFPALTLLPPPVSSCSSCADSFLLLPVSIEAQFGSVSAAVELTDGGASRLSFFRV
jgi:hypothetical protein